jgi:Zn-dependent protease
MSQTDPFLPGQGDEVPPPPPTYPVTSDIPPDSPYHRSPTPSNKSNRGAVGGILAILAAIVTKGGYLLVLLFKIPAAATLITGAISFGAYAWVYGPWVAVAFVAMLFVHEMGHVLEIRRQGMQATAPIFIPFLGAAIFQRSHPTTAVKQAEIGIAGPIAGTIGATAAFALYGATHNPVFLLAAAIGFGLNLLNLIPVWQLDGAWVLAPVSPWLQVAGLATIAAAALFLHFVSFLLIIVAVLGVSTAIQRFRDANNPYYTSVPVQARWALGLAWLALVIYLGVALVQSLGLLVPIAR